MTNKPDLESIEARVTAATPGPWEARCREFCNTERPTSIWSEYGWVCKTEGISPVENAEIISHAIEDIPQLIKAYREQQECIRELVAELHAAHEAEPYLCRDIPALLKKWSLE